jgi:D-alanine-D-alanine ligase
MSQRIKVGIICGGKSSEHEISCISAYGVLHSIDRQRFEPVLIGITKTGRWVLPPIDAQLSIDAGRLPEILESYPAITTDLRGFSCNANPIQLDVIFPVLHGPYGEDGTIQGMLEMAGLRYVGSGVLASAIAMDKSFAKSIFEAAGLRITPGIVILRSQWVGEGKSETMEPISSFGFPVFVKPARSGSSRGTSKVKSLAELETAIDFAFAFDTKVLVEAAIIGREIECAVLQQKGIAHASPIGQIVILGSHEFYDFEAKYLDDATTVDFPTDLPAGVEHEIQQLAIKAFNALDCEGLARVDFFYSNDGEIIINELNTMPGFTQTSVYPKLWQKAGLTYPDLISKLIDAALFRSPDVTR